MNSFDYESLSRQISPVLQELSAELLQSHRDAISDTVSYARQLLQELNSPLTNDIKEQITIGHQILVNQLTDSLKLSIPTPIDISQLKEALRNASYIENHTKSSIKDSDYKSSVPDTETTPDTGQVAKQTSTMEYVMLLIALLQMIISIVSLAQNQTLSDANTELLKEQHQEEMAMRQKELDLQTEELEVAQKSLELLEEIFATRSLQEDDSINTDDLPEFPSEVQAPDYNLPLNQTPLNQIPEDNQ